MQDVLFADQNLLARLDRTPLTRTVIRILVLLALVWLAEAFDIGIVGTVLTVLKGSWHLTASQLGWLGISSTIGVVIGLIPAGILSDKIGRRKVILWGIAAFSLLTLAGAFAANFPQLIAVRVLAGIGEGAVLPMPYLYLAEFVHTKRRAVSVGYANGMLTAAYLLPSLAGVWALHAFPASVSWRIPFILGAIPLILTVPLAFWLPESPRFLLKRNRREDVRQLVVRLENEAGLAHDETLINRRALAVIHTGANVKPDLRALFRRPYLRRGAITAAQLTGALILFYIMLVFGPTLLISRGFGSGNAILFTGIMMAVAGIGSIIQGYLSDRYGRRSVLIVYFALAAIGCGIFGLANNPALIVLAGFLTSFFGLGVFPVSKLSVAEQYPTRIRGEGVYLNELTARTLSGVVTIYWIPFLLAQFGDRAIFEGIAIALLVLALPTVLWGRETAFISVEEAGTELPFSALDARVASAQEDASVSALKR